MANIVVPTGQRVLTVPITVVPAGQAFSASVYLSSDSAGLNSVAAGSQVTAPTSTGVAQNVALPVAAPASGSGLYAWVVVYVNGAYWGTFSQINTVTIGGVTVGQGTWS